MAKLLSEQSAEWLRDQMGIGGIRLKPRRIMHKGGGGEGGVSDIVPCLVDNSGGDALRGYAVSLYANGFDQRRTGSGRLHLPEVATHTKLPYNTAILAHICKATYTQSDESEDAQTDGEE